LVSRVHYREGETLFYIFLLSQHTTHGKTSSVIDDVSQHAIGPAPSQPLLRRLQQLLLQVKYGDAPAGVSARLLLAGAGD